MTKLEKAMAARIEELEFDLGRGAYLPSGRVRYEAHLWRSLIARADDVGLTSDCEHDGRRFTRLLNHITPPGWTQ